MLGQKIRDVKSTTKKTLCRAVGTSSAKGLLDQKHRLISDRFLYLILFCSLSQALVKKYNLINC